MTKAEIVEIRGNILAYRKFLASLYKQQEQAEGELRRMIESLMDAGEDIPE